MQKKILIIALAGMVLLVPHLARFYYFDNFMLGSTPYYHARIAQNIIDGYGRLDPLYSQQVDFNAYHYILAYIGKLTGVLTATNFIPFIAGLLSVYYFYMLSRWYLKNSVLSSIMWIISPIFIYTFTVSNPYSVVVLLNLAGAYYLSRNNWFSLILALTPLFGALNGIFTFTLVYVVYRRVKDRKISAFLLILLPLVTTGMLALGLPRVESSLSPIDNLAFLGAQIGFNAFALILSAIGFMRSWKDGKKPFLYISIAAAALLSLWQSDFKVILNVFLAAFSAVGLIALVSMKWEQKIVRNLTIAILALALLSTTLGYVYRVSASEPYPSMVDALDWLRGEHGYVLTHPDNRYWVEYFARMPVAQANASLWLTRSEERAASDLDSLRVRFILVDDKTVKLMTADNSLGLLFLMQNSPDYRLVETVDTIQVWRYENIIN